jgi:hypothetical protein
MMPCRPACSHVLGILSRRLKRAFDNVNIFFEKGEKKEKEEHYTPGVLLPPFFSESYSASCIRVLMQLTCTSRYLSQALFCFPPCCWPGFSFSILPGVQFDEKEEKKEKDRGKQILLVKRGSRDSHRKWLTQERGWAGEGGNKTRRRGGVRFTCACGLCS